MDGLRWQIFHLWIVFRKYFPVFLPLDGAMEQSMIIIFIFISRSCTLILPNYFQQMSEQLVLDLGHLVVVLVVSSHHIFSLYRYGLYGRPIRCPSFRSQKIGHGTGPYSVTINLETRMNLTKPCFQVHNSLSKIIFMYPS